MKKSLVGVIDLKPELKCEQSVIVEYFRTETEEGEESHFHSRPYGIEVVKKQKIDGIIYREIKSINNITNTAESADELLGLLCRNSVTPICVSEVLEDIVSEKLNYGGEVPV